MIKLVSVNFTTTPRMPGLCPTDLGSFTTEKPGDALKNWRIVIRGGQVFFVSPPGWTPDQSSRSRGRLKSEGTITVHGPVALSEVYLEWRVVPEPSPIDPKNPTKEQEPFDVRAARELDLLYKGIGKYESEPFGFEPAPVMADKPILEQIPAGQMGDV